MPPRFANLDPAHRPHGPWAVFRWGVWERCVRRRPIARAGPPAPRAVTDRGGLEARGPGVRLTWIGHASFLGRLGDASFLIDPVFSTRIGWVVRRHGRPGLLPQDLPRVDALLVTHNHYDHLDAASIRALPRAISVFVPLGLGRWFRRRGFERVHELGWWQAADARSLRITLVPACHWSRRSIGDTNRSLWGGFVVASAGVSVYHGGDTAYFAGFREIGRRFPGLDAALLPIGAYAPAWFMERYHMTPEQAGRAFLELGARELVPMHWGAFKLTDEPLSEPIGRLRTWWGTHVPPGSSRRLCLPAVGETLTIEAGDGGTRS